MRELKSHLAVDLAAVADADDEDGDPPILDPRDEPVIADPPAPITLVGAP